MTTESIVERDWLTPHGYRCVVLKASMGHRCGYVGVPPSHPLYGCCYSENHPGLPSVRDMPDEPLDKRSPILALTLSADSHSPEAVFNVHGGLTFSAYGDRLPVAAPHLWFFGFDAAHCDDAPELTATNAEYRHTLFHKDCVVRTTGYMVSECLSLAEQLAKVRPVRLLDRLVWLVTARLARLFTWAGRFWWRLRWPLSLRKLRRGVEATTNANS